MLADLQPHAPWLMLAAGSLVGGVSLVCLLVVPRRYVFPFLALVGSGIVVAFAGVFSIAMRSGRIGLALVTSAMGFLLFALAYSVGTLALSWGLERAMDGEQGHEDSEPGLEEDDLDPSVPVVIVTACAQPESYSPLAVAAHLAEFEATDVPLPSWSARPMLFAAERTRYRTVDGMSPARPTVRDIAADLGDRLRERGDDPVVTTAWCHRSPTLESTVRRLADRGTRAFLVVRLTVADTLRTDRVRRAVDDVLTDRPNVRIAYTPPLWGERALAELIVTRVLAAVIDAPRETVGVCLVGHGQPESWSRTHPSWLEQETFFHQRIRADLEDAGIAGTNVRLAWLDWTEPSVTEVVRHLAAVGCRSIVVVPSAMPFDSLGTLLDLRAAVNYARVSDSADTIVLDAWGRDERVVDVLVKQAEKALDESRDR
jgi:protoheme ferro-lyase